MAQELNRESQTTEDSIDGSVKSPFMVGSSLIDEVTLAACKMLDDGIVSRQPRFNDIRKNEDMVNGVIRPALAGRSNVPFDSILMRGYRGSLLANTDEAVQLKYGHTREQGKMAADKITACFEIEKGPTKGAWDEKVMDCKSSCFAAGRGFLKLRMGNIPKFYSDMDWVDHYDMVTEPQGGGDLDNHLFKFQMNIFKTKEDILSNEEYDTLQVRRLILRYNDAKWFKDNDDIFNNKAARYAAYGIDIRANNYVGQPLYRLIEGAVNYKGRWYHLVFSREAKLGIELKPLEEKFFWAKEYAGRGAIVSFATNRDAAIFWSPAPADDVRPIAYAMKKVLNLTIDNLEKRNWDMKAYDPRVFTEPSQLLWRPNGLVKATLKPGSAIAQGIFEFQTPDTTQITINLTQYLDAFLGKQTGITPDNPNQPATDPRVGIQISNIEQTSKRMTLNNKSYRKMYTDLGVMFDYGCNQYLREEYTVKLIGIMGVKWDAAITREDTNEELSLTVTSSLEEDEKNATMLARRKEMFDTISENQTGLIKTFNQKWLGAEMLKTAGYTDEVTKIALDPQIDGDEELYAECAGSIQSIVDGETLVPLNRGATPGFIQKIIDFADDTYDLYPDSEVKKMTPNKQRSYQKQVKIFQALVQYAKLHLPIAQANMQRRQTLLQINAAMAAMSSPQSTGGAPAPAPQGQPQPSAPMPMPAGSQPVAANAQ